METAEAIPEAGEPTATTSATVVTAATVTTVATSTTTATTGDVSAFLTGLEKLLLSTLVHLNKEALWILSNIAGVSLCLSVSLSVFVSLSVCVCMCVCQFVFVSMGLFVFVYAYMCVCVILFACVQFFVFFCISCIINITKRVVILNAIASLFRCTSGYNSCGLYYY